MWCVWHTFRCFLLQAPSKHWIRVFYVPAQMENSMWSTEKADLCLPAAEGRQTGGMAQELCCDRAA